VTGVQTCALPISADVGKRSSRTLAELALRERPGSPWLLEPDLKDGAGGRRDYDELTWTAAVVTGSLTHDPEALVAAGALTAEELARLTRAAETVGATRWSLQRDGHGDRMALDALESLGDLDAEAVQAALGETALVLAAGRARVAKRAPMPTAPLSAAEVLGLLGEGDAGLASLELAAQAGRLDGLVPGYRALMSVRRPGLGHTLTVGAHSLKAAALAGGSHQGDRALMRSRETVSDVRPLQVAALAHDIGKTEGGAGHAERGANPATAAALAFGLGEHAAAQAAELVRNHLLLVETALREDLDDEDAILRCAGRVGQRDLIAPLHLLTAADSLATGPATWTPWTATLVGTLVARLDAALSENVDGAGLATRGEAVRAAAFAATPGSSDAERAFIEAAPLRYLASREPSEVARDARLVAELSASPLAEAARIAVSAGPVEATWSVTVAAVDRPQLLARVAGAMALAGLDILSVDAYGSAGRVALDSFVVTSATHAAVRPETFTSLERLIRAALRDRLELATRLAERRRHYPVRSKVRLKVDVTPSGWDTAVRVTAPDRPGLLHDLACAVSAAELDIRWARVQTVDGVARDTFHVVGPDGGPVDDPGILGHLAMRIRESV